MKKYYDHTKEFYLKHIKKELYVLIGVVGVILGVVISLLKTVSLPGTLLLILYSSYFILNQEGSHILNLIKKPFNFSFGILRKIFNPIFETVNIILKNTISFVFEFISIILKIVTYIITSDFFKTLIKIILWIIAGGVAIYLIGSLSPFTIIIILLALIMLRLYNVF